MKKTLILIFFSLFLLSPSVYAFPKSEGETDLMSQNTHDHSAHAPMPVNPRMNFLSGASRDRLGSLFVQDFRGRMKPLDTLSREMLMKVTKKSSYEGWEPLDLFLSWTVHPEHWLQEPLIAIRFPGLKELLGLSEDTDHVSAASLMDGQGRYLLGSKVEEALRTADRSRSKLQRKLLIFDERFNLLLMSMQGQTLRIYPVPGDENNTWEGSAEIFSELSGETLEEYRGVETGFHEALRNMNGSGLLVSVSSLADLQEKYGSEVLPSSLSLGSELLLNRWKPFSRVTLPYLGAFILLALAYVISLLRRKGEPWTLKSPLYAIGFLLFAASFFFHLIAYVLRWFASGRAPLSNGYESLIFIAMAVAVAGLIFEWKDRRGILAGLASFLSASVLGVAMMATFDPAIGPLVPVLNSYWLIIHVTVITGSYGFLGLGALMAVTILALHFFKGPDKDFIRQAIRRLNDLHWKVLTTGLGMLSIGTLLGGVWANESWGRYWGWDSKEPWSLVTILVYASVVHFRWVKALNRPWTLAAGSFFALSSVLMTYFGVNYLLSGLHSYAGGEAVSLPAWVYYGSAFMLLLLASSRWFDKNRHWEVKS